MGWVDRAGAFTPLPMPERGYVHVRLSPDNRLIAADTADDLDVWVHDLERATTNRLTVEQTNLHPVWSADGRRVIFDSTQNAGLFWANPDGQGRELLLEDASHTMSAVSVTPDGQFVAFERSENYSSFDIGILPLTGPRAARMLMSSAFRESAPVFSRDGRWLAYVTNESGREEVYAQPFPGPGTRVLLSTDGGRDRTGRRPATSCSIASAGR